MIRREVVQEKVVHLAGGRRYRLRRGDIVALFPLLSPQMDPEIHQEPQVASLGLPVGFPTGLLRLLCVFPAVTQLPSVGRRRQNCSKENKKCR